MDDTTDFVPVEHLPYAKELKTRLPYTESKLRTEIAEAIGKATACWENLGGAGVFQSDRAVEIYDELVESVLALTDLGEPSLGCATNAELRTELETRLRHGNTDDNYRTVED